MEMLTDNPTIEDQFGFKPYSEILAGTILETYSLPFSIGIFGPWGTGKSSLMMMIEKEIANEPLIKTAWFNPWKYDKREELWNALIQSILYKIVEDAPDAQLKENAKKLAISTGWSLLKKGISSLSGGIVSEGKIEEFKNALAQQDELHYKYINQFEQDFEKVVDSYTGNGKLVIFIDDLDRCLPENAIAVLESLKLFIGNARCVFVLGMDQYIVEQGIKFRFGDKVEMSGRDYLDKIIQVPFYLPPVPFHKLKQALNAPKSALYQHDDLWYIIQLGLNGNPRRTKRFINCFYLAEKMLHHSQLNLNAAEPGGQPTPAISEKDEKFYLAQLLIFQMVFADFYEHLKLNPADWPYIYNDIVNAFDPKTQDENIHRRPEIQEHWSNIELRNFLIKSAPDIQNDFPDPPEEAVVQSLINAVSLVSESRATGATGPLKK